jgi:hypothetical protein
MFALLEARNNQPFDLSVLIGRQFPNNGKSDLHVVDFRDKVTLHFIGVLGVHHIITVDGVGTFSLHRGEIHTVYFIANNPGTINSFCSVHLPNMVGQILVLPKSV